VSRVFLTAEWRNLVMLNFTVDPAVLEPFVPSGTALDAWHGSTYLSLVGFLFADTRVLGLPVPGHRVFEEVNLRFYVRREMPGEVRHAVTFIRELVPRRAIALTARLAYNEPYRALPMRHVFGATRPDGGLVHAAYAWRVGGTWTSLKATTCGEGVVPALESHEAFITEHYWGYARQRNGSTVEYEVEHPRWKVWPVEGSPLGGDLVGVYGSTFAAILHGSPTSAFLANGSRVTVSAPNRLHDTSPSSRQAAR
jgi:hypothetical protein